MSSQLTFADVQSPITLAQEAGRRNAEACAANADRHEPNWTEDAYAALLEFAASQSTVAWSGETAVEWAHQRGLPRPHDLRAWGAVFQRAAREKRIARSTQLFPRKLGHGTMTPGWRTLAHE